MPRVSSVIADLPILRRELIAQASQRRIYLLRVAFAAGVFGLSMAWLAGRGSELSSLRGDGDVLLGLLTMAEQAAIFLVLPAIAAGAIASERERGTLPLLLTTPLSPARIVAEKAVARALPVLTFFFLAMPLAAVAYSIGGVTPAHLWTQVGLHVLTCFEIAVVTVMISALSETTRTATMGAYGMALPLWAFHVPLLLAHDLGGWVAASPIVFLIVFFTCACFVVAPPLVKRPILYPTVPPSAAPQPVPQGEGGVGSTGVPDRSRLVGTSPIVWREVSNRPLGVAFNIALGMAILLGGSAGTLVHAMPALIVVMWFAGLAIVSVSAARPVAAERAACTLDLLLATPRGGGAIVREKLARAWRWGLIWAVTIASAVGAWTLVSAHVVEIGPLAVESTPFRFTEVGWWPLATAVAIGVGFPLAAWLSMWIGLRSASPLRATTASLATVGLGAGVPAFVASAPAGPASPIHVLHFLSPGGLFLLADHSPLLPPWVAIPLDGVCSGGLLWHTRRYCLRHADWYLGRATRRSSDT